MRPTAFTAAESAAAPGTQHSSRHATLLATTAVTAAVHAFHWCPRHAHLLLMLAVSDDVVVSTGQGGGWSALSLREPRSPGIRRIEN